MLVSCGNDESKQEPTIEEKAESLISEQLKSTLYHPETYKPISTQVDSAFINLENLAKIGEICEDLTELFQKQDEYANRLRSAESDKSIYAPNRYYNSEFRRTQYNQAKEECEELQAKLNRIAPKIEEAINELKSCSKNIYCDEFTGWMVYHKFTSKNGANTVTLSGEVIYICDKELSRCGGGMELEHFEKFMKFINNISELETEDEIKEEIYDFIYDERIGI